MDLQIDGIYDQRTIKCLLDEGIRRFVFDFRPTSFNFFQQHRFLDLIKSCYRADCHYLLHFSNEADFIVKKFIEDLSSLNLLNMDRTFSLAFSDVHPMEYYEQFSMPYHLYYHRQVEHGLWKNSRFLRGIIYDFEFLNELHQGNGLLPFVQNFSQLIVGLQLVQTLVADWNSNFFPSLFDYFDFDVVSYPINKKVEVCYRNVDLALLRKQIIICKNNLES